MKDKLKTCWINKANCVNQTNDVRKCIECIVWNGKYRKNL